MYAFEIGVCLATGLRVKDLGLRKSKSSGLSKETVGMRARDVDWDVGLKVQSWEYPASSAGA